jgi:hypothetical protein
MGKNYPITKSVQNTFMTTGIGTNEDRKLKGKKENWMYTLFRSFRYICHMNLWFEIWMGYVCFFYPEVPTVYYLENRVKQDVEVL